MAKKKSRAGANMIASVMEQAMADDANIVEAAPAVEQVSEPAADVGVPDDGEPIVENDILVKNLMVMKTELQYDDVCNAKEEVIKLSKENSDLKDKIAEYIDAVAKLERDNASLQKEYDDCLLKISELSFEVAQLKASLSEAESNLNNTSNSSSQKSTRTASTPVSYQYKNNGYSAWN